MTLDSSLGKALAAASIIGFAGDYIMGNGIYSNRGKNQDFDSVIPECLFSILPKSNKALVPALSPIFKSMRTEARKWPNHITWNQKMPVHTPMMHKVGLSNSYW
jgi:hypothetical protein